MPRPVWLFALWLSLPGWGQPSPPGLPPASPTVPLTQQLPAQSGLAQRYQLKAGWNALSFPFRKVTASQGIDSLVEPNSATAISPVEAQPGRGYWVFSQKDAQACVWGETQDTSCTLTLQQGWNLVGSPEYDPLPLFQVTASDDTEFNRILEEICPGWVDAKMVLGSQKIPLGPASVWQPGAAYWLYANRTVRLRVSQSDEVPVITSLGQSEIKEQIIEGEHFGAADTGRLMVGAEPLPDSSLYEWTPTKIRFRLPADPPDASVTVVAGASASRRVSRDEFQPAKNRFSLKVQSEDGQPIARASAWVDGVYAGQSDRWGVVQINGIERGQHRLKVSRPNFLTRDAQWNAGGRTPNLTLYSPRSSISVRVTPCAGGFRPYKIEIYQKSDWTKRYYNTWYYHQAAPYVDLIWNSVPTNLVYRIDITWRDRDQVEKYLHLERTLGPYGLRETFYNYWNAYPY